MDVARETLLEGFMNGQAELVSRGSGQISEFLGEMAPQEIEISKLLVLSLLGSVCQVLINLKCEGGSVRNWARRQMLNLMAPNTPLGIRKIFAESMDQAWNIRGSATDSGAAIIQQSLQYIHEHYDEVTLESLAENVHVSPSYLSRLFRRVLKRRFVDEVKAVRIERAKILLSQGLSVRDVALEVGYGNIAYFSTLFRQTTGQSPSEYRKTFR
jgi:two-component system response regulator YesN